MITCSDSLSFYMSLSSSAKRNIARGALNSYLADPRHALEASTLLAQAIIEREIGYSSKDVHPSLFQELVAELIDPIEEKISELGD